MPNKPVPFITIAGADAAIISESDLLQLSCGTDGCPSTCCKASAPIILNPYEIALMCCASGKSYENLLDIVDTDRANGFPLVMLPRDPVCFFWTETGCRIYEARPLACRLFPLGRVFDKEQSHLVLPEQNRCTGLAMVPKQTVADYLRSQNVDKLILMADRWIEFVSFIEKIPLPDAPVTSVAFHMLVYSPDTPPTKGIVVDTLSLEDRFLLRLVTAKEQLPLFLKRTS